MAELRGSVLQGSAAGPACRADHLLPGGRIGRASEVRRLKGATRPVNPLEHRLSVLGMLECVDYLVVFSEDTPETLYCEVLPQVLVKGGDYTAAQVAGGECVSAAGGRVAILDLVPGLSSTRILSKLGEFD